MMDDTHDDNNDHDDIHNNPTTSSSYTIHHHPHHHHHHHHHHHLFLYVGAKIALYFCFTGHYTTWLCNLSKFSSIDLTKVSLIAVIYVSTSAIVNNSLDLALSGSYFLPFYCIFVSLWSQLMLEYWKRYVCLYVCM